MKTPIRVAAILTLAVTFSAALSSNAQGVQTPASGTNSSCYLFVPLVTVKFPRNDTNARARAANVTLALATNDFRTGWVLKTSFFCQLSIHRDSQSDATAFLKQSISDGLLDTTDLEFIFSSDEHKSLPNQQIEHTEVPRHDGCERSRSTPHAAKPPLLICDRWERRSGTE